MWSWLSTACLVAAGAGCLYLVAAAILVGRFARQAAAPASQSPSVTILKPLHGEEPGLFDNLASFCAQEYAGPVQIVFGVQDPSDPAIGIATRLIEAFPDKALELVIDASRHGSNAKISNLINMAARIRHDIVVLADSDMRVLPDYLARTVAALHGPGVGGVTCLYRGLASEGLWSRLSALAVDAHFLPNVGVGVGLGLARPCFGSTIALRRTTLAEIGGLDAFANILADDYAIGAAIRARGYEVAIPPFAIGHVCSEASFEDLWRHEIRWARTIRIVDPLGYAGAAVTHALPLALLGWLFGAVIAGPILAGAAVACRIAVCVRVERAFGVLPHPYWLVPVRDLLSFAVFIASFVSGAVTWKGHDFRVVANGTLVPDRRSPSP